MAKDGIDVVETADAIARRGFRATHSAENAAVAGIRGRSCVANLLLA
jgi:hypothetical protein